MEGRPMKLTMSVLVKNHAGILYKVAGLFSRRAYNIHSLAVGTTSDPRVSRMNIVVDGDEKVIGIMTERDILNKLLNKDRDPKTTKVSEIMTPMDKMFTVKPETTGEDCMVLITAKRIRHVPVFEDDKFVGLISIGDVVKSIISEKDMLIEHLSNYIAGKYI